MKTRIEEERIIPRFRSRGHALFWLRNWYYPSDHWRDTSRRIRREHPYCQRCKWRRSVQTHHLSYEHLWNERDSELMAICVPCHEYLERVKRRNKRK